MAFWRMSCLCGSKWGAEHLISSQRTPVITSRRDPSRHTARTRRKVKKERKKNKNRAANVTKEGGRKRRESLKREHSGGRSGTVTAVIDESHDQRVSHLYTFTAQDHTHQHVARARAHAHIPSELHSNFAACSPDEVRAEFAPAGMQPISGSR